MENKVKHEIKSKNEMESELKLAQQNADVEKRKDVGSIAESRLNPDAEKLTAKDPDEIIILPNEELKINKHNKNQPF